MRFFLYSKPELHRFRNVRRSPLAEGKEEAEKTIDDQIRDLRKENLDGLDEANAGILEATHIGVSTTHKLARQNEDLRKAERDLDDNEENIDSAEQQLGRIEKLQGPCWICFLACPDHAPPSVQRRHNRNEGKIRASAKVRHRRNETQPLKKKTSEIKSEGKTTEGQEYENNFNNKLDNLGKNLEVLLEVTKDQKEELNKTPEVTKALNRKIDDQR